MMQPTLFPAGGAAIGGLQDAVGLLSQVARQTAANATMEVAGALQADVSTRGGVRITANPQVQLECFEILTCWEKTNAYPKPGGNKGRFWICKAKPVTYWEDTDQATYWDRTKQDGWRYIFWPVTGLDEEDDSSLSDSTSASGLDSSGDCHESKQWQKTLYPLYGKGQWVWCVFDYSANVWRVIHNYDGLVRFKLTEELRGCGWARAEVVGYPCKECDHEESGSSLFGSSSFGSEAVSVAPPPKDNPHHHRVCRVVKDVAFDSKTCKLEIEYCEIHLGPGSWCTCGAHMTPTDSSGFEREPSSETASYASQASSILSEEEECLKQARDRGTIKVYDPAGIVNVQFPDCRAPAGATGWCKWEADARRFEAVTYGMTFCPASVNNEF